MRNITGLLTVVTLVCSLTFLSCSKPGPVTINYGQDECDHCRMTIADKKFGSELVTSKGKAYKFDSIECLAAYRYNTELSASDIHSMWVTDFSHPGAFLNAEAATIIASERTKSPMGMGLLAVNTEQEAAKLIQVVGGKILPWDQIVALVATDWKLSK